MTEGNQVKFIDNHIPSLTAGDYTITVTQTVSVAPTPFSRSQKFSILGPRFTLDHQEVQAVFPPPGSLGEHSNVLPHIILKRSTLPWERSADGKQTTPWLALLLFDENDKLDTDDKKNKFLLDQIKNPNSWTLKELSANTVELPKSSDNEATRNIYTVHFPNLTLESGDHNDDVVAVIDVPQKILKQILPSTTELKYLSHVRQTIDAKGNTQGDEVAVIICNRLPQKGSMSIVHLVSIEGRYDNNGFNYQGANENELIRLVSLYSWRFACVSEEHNFKGLLMKLNSGTLRLSSIASETADKYFSMGSVPLHHEMRQGNKSVSWYHGPFITGNNAKNSSFTVCSADELVLYNSEIGMFDVSYSAAWELGRLLTLQNKQVSVDLFNWKRSCAQSDKNGKQKATNIPVGNVPPDTQIPETVRTWFDDLNYMKGIPFNYLVPDERMLPAESIRFFQVDPTWVECLRDGAFSIGRVLSTDHTLDGTLKKSLPGKKNLSGILLRSDVVAGWPGLLVDGYDDQMKILDKKMERLSRNVLLCLFEGIIHAVDIHQKPETLHFGVNRLDNGNTGWCKTKRNKKGEETSEKIDIPFKKVDDRIINMTGLVTNLGTNISSDFAFQMIEGVEKVRFNSN